VLKTYRINKIDFTRKLERDMLDGRPEDLERIGVELGYTVAQQKFGIKDLVISESPKGLELYPRDRTAVLGTKLVDLRNASPEKRVELEAMAVNELTDKVKRELDSSPSANLGLVFVSYFGEDKILKMNVVEIAKV
jgi:hypothetical protein